MSSVGAARATLRGPIVPVVTPFKDGALDLDGLGQLIDWQIANGTHGISVTGTTGEPTSLTLDERRRAQAAAEAVAHRVPVCRERHGHSR